MYFNKFNAPCKDCPKKGCGSYHDECELYQKYREGCIEENKASYEARYKYYSAIAVDVNRAHRLRKDYGRH